VLETVEFVASSLRTPDRSWILTSFQAARVLAEMFSSKEISDIMTGLNCGEVVTLPGAFGPTELTALGYRLKFDA
jgi:hypothetical protein